MITTELEKPDNASSGVRMWNTNKPINAQSATMSDRTFPDTKKAADNTKIRRVTSIALKS